MTTITQTPAAQVSPGIFSKWLSAFNDCYFDLQCKDKDVSAATNAFPGTTFTIPTGYASAGLSIGQSVYISAGNYNGTFRITGFPSATQIKTDAPYSGAALAGAFINFITAYANFHVLINVYKVTQVGDTLIDTFRLSPDAKGLIEVNVSASINRVIFKNKYGYSVINEADQDLSGAFKFAYQEIYIKKAPKVGPERESPELVDTLVQSAFIYSEVFYYSGTAKQLQAPGGSNLSPHVPALQILQVDNLNFANGLSGWTLIQPIGTAFSVVMQKMKFSSTSPAAVGDAIKSVLTPGKTYRIYYRITQVVDMDFVFIFGSNPGITRSAPGYYFEDITANGSNLIFRFTSQANPSSLTVGEVVIIETPQTHLAKFLCEGDFIPTYFDGYPFDLSFIYSDNISTPLYQVQRKREFYNQAGNSIATDSADLNSQHRKFVNRLRSTDNIAAGTSYFEEWLEIDEIISTQLKYVNAGYVLPGFVEGD